MDPILILRGILCGWWFANFAPLQDYITKYVKPHIKNVYLNQGLSCFKCQAFWWTLAWTNLDIFAAITAALIAYIFDKVMNSFKTYL